MQPDCCFRIESRRVVSHKTHWYGCSLKRGVIFVFCQNNAAESKIRRPTNHVNTKNLCNFFHFAWADGLGELVQGGHNDVFHWQGLFVILRDGPM